ncbi:MAG: hypothetical protein QF471_01780 [Phycisphaerales bacterium]|jgi:hypothetical protein|nr:hypothetical protein [Phycisphaerales bacterium]
MSLTPSRARLRETCVMLRNAWENAGQSWTDSQHDYLGEHFIRPLEQSLRTAENAIDTMDEILRQAQRDCE